MVFTLMRPSTVPEVLKLLEENPKARLKAGGTDLLIWLKKGLIKADHLIDLGLIKELKAITWIEGQGLQIGAMATLNDVIHHPMAKKYFPSLVQACMTHSDPILRNQATVVGNLCSAVPSADCIPPLLCHRAMVNTSGPKETRTMSVEQWIIAPRTTRILPGEMVTSIFLPYASEMSRSTAKYLRLSRRKALDLAQVCVCALFEWNGSGFQSYLSLGAVSAVPFRCVEAEKMLNESQKVDDSTLGQVADLAAQAAKPITDVRASKDFRFQMIRELTQKALLAAYEEGRGQ